MRFYKILLTGLVLSLPVFSFSQASVNLDEELLERMPGIRPKYERAIRLLEKINSAQCRMRELEERAVLSKQEEKDGVAVKLREITGEIPCGISILGSSCLESLDLKHGELSRCLQRTVSAIEDIYKDILVFIEGRPASDLSWVKSGKVLIPEPSMEDLQAYAVTIFRGVEGLCEDLERKRGASCAPESSLLSNLCSNLIGGFEHMEAFYNRAISRIMDKLFFEGTLVNLQKIRDRDDPTVIPHILDMEGKIANLKDSFKGNAPAVQELTGSSKATIGAWLNAVDRNPIWREAPVLQEMIRESESLHHNSVQILQDMENKETLDLLKGRMRRLETVYSKLEQDISLAIQYMNDSQNKGFPHLQREKKKWIASFQKQHETFSDEVMHVRGLMSTESTGKNVLDRIQSTMQRVDNFWSTLDSRFVHDYQEWVRQREDHRFPAPSAKLEWRVTKELPLEILQLKRAQEPYMFGAIVRGFNAGFCVLDVYNLHNDTIARGKNVVLHPDKFDLSVVKVGDVVVFNKVTERENMAFALDIKSSKTTENTPKRKRRS